jgi:hypothetical protein
LILIFLNQFNYFFYKNQIEPKMITPKIFFLLFFFIAWAGQKRDSIQWKQAQRRKP